MSLFFSPALQDCGATPPSPRQRVPAARVLAAGDDHGNLLQVLFGPGDQSFRLVRTCWWLHENEDPVRAPVRVGALQTLLSPQPQSQPTAFRSGRSWGAEGPQ